MPTLRINSVAIVLNGVAVTLNDADVTGFAAGRLAFAGRAGRIGTILNDSQRTGTILNPSRAGEQLELTP